MKMTKVKMLAPSPMLCLLSLLIASFFHTTAAQIGVCYGMDATNLPNPSDVVAMYEQYNIKRMRLYGPNDETLNALRGSNIELILHVPNDNLVSIASSQTEANTWVQNNVKNYNGVTFKYISVGNEVNSSSEAKNILMQAMQNVDKAVYEAGLSIKVTTTTFMGAFTDAYPPSQGRLKDEYSNFLTPVIGYLVNKQSPLLVNIYTYFGYVYDPNISLDFALLNPNVGFKDPNTQYSYTNLFDASIDSVYAALEKAGGGSLDVVVSETGWPTSGEKGASVENAKTYVNNVIQRVKNGSPRRPGKAIETYLFAMFNENKKSPEYEKWWGLFLPNKQPQYDVKFN